MEQRLIGLRNFAQRRNYKVFRSSSAIAAQSVTEARQAEQDLCRRSARVLEMLCRSERPLLFPGEQIAYCRSNGHIPGWYDQEEAVAQTGKPAGTFFLMLNNVCPNWSLLLNEGLVGRRRVAEHGLRKAAGRQKIFLESVLIAIDAVKELAGRYAEEARRTGNHTVASILDKVPFQPAGTFHEALQSLRFMSSMLILNGYYQFGFGRLDQYLFPFYQRDTAAGRLNRSGAAGLLAEFFISLNKDSDLYFGVQQGDNGQSLMLGGVRPDGTSGINDLTYMAMEVSRDLKLIDPKINLRVDSRTPDDLLQLGAQLTEAGLGFPQYANDEIVVPALVRKGYSLEDARDYTVAACWEFIIPGKGLDTVNLGAVSFPAAVDNALRRMARVNRPSMENLHAEVRAALKEQIIAIFTRRRLAYVPSPLASTLFDGALESGRDVSDSALYRNFGLHGAASAEGADALAAIACLLEGGERTLEQVVDALNTNFAHDEALYEMLRTAPPKTGNADRRADDELAFLFRAFADVCEEAEKEGLSGGRWIRPGTGSAQFYVLLSGSFPWLVEPTVGATADGRKKGEPFSSSLAPANGAQVLGPLSVLRSFSVIDYSRVMNGGPITMELAPSVFNAQDAYAKLASLIRFFVQTGNQQLQINLLGRETLLDAVKHPERHRNLIVRVWGWSGYFCELAPEFQKQIITRHSYSI
ncbi:MAG: hypothetical protein LBO64_02435 [Desulfovibrio sp.]|jgi:formate C-acetyltransferase|nr:hypothetical protein [Desulfovibrio sp.]